MPDYPRRKNGQTKVRYFDPNDNKANSSNCWRDTPPGRPYETAEDACNFPQDHLECFASPAVIHQINRTRRKLDETLPEINFYAFVQHEGETVILKPKIWHMIVSVGQCYGVSHAYIRPKDAAEVLLEPHRTEVRCRCRDGKRDGVADGTTLPLREVEKRPLPEDDNYDMDADASDDERTFQAISEDHANEVFEGMDNESDKDTEVAYSESGGSEDKEKNGV